MNNAKTEMFYQTLNPFSNTRLNGNQADDPDNIEINQRRAAGLRRRCSPRFSFIVCYQPAAENSEWVVGGRVLKNNPWTLKGIHMIVRRHVMGLCGFTAPHGSAHFNTLHLHRTRHQQITLTTCYTTPAGLILCIRWLHHVFLQILSTSCKRFIVMHFACSCNFKCIKHLRSTMLFRPIQGGSWGIVMDVWMFRRRRYQWGGHEEIPW